MKTMMTSPEIKMVKINNFPCYDLSEDGSVSRKKLIENFDGEIVSLSIPLKQQCIANKFMKVSLSSKNGTKSVYIHKLVAEHFVENPNNYPDVRHIDGDVFNNHYSNLEWYDKKQETLAKKQIEKHKKEAEKLIEKAKQLIG